MHRREHAGGVKGEWKELGGHDQNTPYLCMKLSINKRCQKWIDKLTISCFTIWPFIFVCMFVCCVMYLHVCTQVYMLTHMYAEAREEAGCLLLLFFTVFLTRSLSEPEAGSFN